MFKKQLFPAIGAIVIGVGIAAAGYFISQTMLNQRISANTAGVKGLSERIVASDAATWNLTYILKSENLEAVASSFGTAKIHTARIKQTLEKSGFDADEFIIGPLVKHDVTKRNKDGNIVEKYFTVSANIFVSTDDPKKIAPAARAVAALSRDGIDVNQRGGNYEFTKLNDIKPDMLREATENARLAEDKFAENAGVRVGGIQRAVQGGFSVQPANKGDAKTRELKSLSVL